MSEKWDRRFLDLAAYVATWSKDPSTHVGAAIVRLDRTVASLGFNGFPRRVDDSGERICDRSKKLLYSVHAEMNAILTAHERLHGCTMYVTLHPCSACAGAIIQSGISRVVIPITENNPSRWQDSFLAAETMLKEAGIVISTIEFGNGE